MTGSGDNADLYLYSPSTTNVDTDLIADYSVEPGNNESINFWVPVSGFWYIDIYAFQGVSQYEFTATVSNP